VTRCSAWNSKDTILIAGARWAEAAAAMTRTTGCVYVALSVISFYSRVVYPRIDSVQAGIGKRRRILARAVYSHWGLAQGARFRLLLSLGCTRRTNPSAKARGGVPLGPSVMRAPCFTGPRGGGGAGGV
jgi:hypothetical protein